MVDFVPKTMTLGVPFGIDFSTFSKKLKVVNSLHREYFWKFLASQNLSFFDGFLIDFRIFSKTTPGDYFWRVQAPIYVRKCGFGAHFGISGVPQIESFQLFWVKKCIKNHEANLPGPTWGAYFYTCAGERERERESEISPDRWIGR